jgi:IMP dehydrogenase
MILSEALTFDDVLLKPKRSSIASRKDVNLKTKISKNIELNIPFVSANMNTVTESRMAIEMARLGGIGIIHRFIPIDKEAEEVAKVKRAENYVVEEPFTIRPDLSLKIVKNLIKRLDIQTFLVVDDYKKLLGILTKRDHIFESRENIKIGNIMTPLERLITGKPGTSLEEAKFIFQKHKIEKLPLVDTKGRLVGLITVRDLLHRLNSFALKDKRGRLLVGAAIGVGKDYLERAYALVEAGVDILVVDIAHGHLNICINAVKTLK